MLLNYIYIVLNYINWVLLEYPLYILYIHGPSLNGWLFYEGRSIDEICADLTNVPNQHWLLNISECKSLISRKLTAIIVFIYFMVYMMIIFTTIFVMYTTVIKRNVN
jgi:hypothetical protein